MKTILLTFILTLLNFSNSFGQTNKLEIINSTGRVVRIYSTHYLKDSTKNSSYLLLCKRLKDKPCAMTSQSNLYLDNIRLDIIAVDDSTNDTVYVKSFAREQINREPFIIDIQNNITKLPPDFVTLPFLQIKAKDFKKVYKITDPIDVKLLNREKLQGIIKSFDKETITIEDFDKKRIIIQRKELAGIKSCGPVWAVGARISFLHHCNYTDLENIKFRVVRQVLVTKPDKTSTYEWKE